MAIVERFNAYSMAQFAEKVMTYNAPFITYTEGILYFGTEMYLSYVPYQTKVFIDGTETISTALNWGVTGTCYVAVSDTLFYAQFNDPGGRRIVMFYEIVDGIHVYGARGSSGNGTMSYKQLTEITMKGNDNLPYSHGAVLNYDNLSDTLDYTTDVLYGSSYKRVLDPNLVACSTVPTNYIIKFDGKEYFSLSTHILIAKDNT